MPEFDFTPTVDTHLQAVNLILGWNGKAISAELALTIEPGSVLVVAGPNGAGKSTLLKTMARLAKPVSGCVIMGDDNIWEMSGQKFACLVAYLPQISAEGLDLNVFEIVKLGRSPHQKWWSWAMSGHDEEVVFAAMQKTNTWDLRTKRLANLSGGERQRVRIACALAQEPKFLLLDEPAAHLDFRHQLELVDLLGELRKQGLGIAVVLHDLNLISRLADRVLLIAKQNGGLSKVIAEGAPNMVLTELLLRSAYDVEVSVGSDPKSGQNFFVPKS